MNIGGKQFVRNQLLGLYEFYFCYRVDIGILSVNRKTPQLVKQEIRIKAHY